MTAHPADPQGANPDGPIVNGIPLDWEGQDGQWRRYLLDLRTDKSKTPSQRVMEELFHVYHHTDGDDADQARAATQRARELLADRRAPAETPALDRAIKACEERAVHLERTSKMLDHSGKLEHWYRICEAKHIANALRALKGQP